MRKLLSAIVAVLWLAFVSCAQGTGSVSPISLLKPDLPLAYVVYDHLGPGTPELESEAPVRLWLRLVNNSSLPISVATLRSSPRLAKGEIRIADSIRWSAGVFICATGNQFQQDVPLSRKLIEPGKAAEVPEQPKPKQAATGFSCMDKPPAGYSDFPEYSYDSVELPSGKDLLFTVPANHIAPDGRWYIEIPFSFQGIPTIANQNENANRGGTIRIAVQYGIENIPKEHRVEFEAAYTPAPQ